MTSEASDPRKALERERDRLDGMLEKDDAWRALQQLDQRETEGRPDAAAETSALRTHIEAALADNRVYQARRKLSEAITLLAAPLDPPPASAKPVAVPLAGDARPPADDLTLIRGIDGALAGRLQALGVDGFAAISAWNAAEVQRITAALDLGRRIHRENWIEQAALILARRRPLSSAVPQAAASAPVARPPAVLEPAPAPAPAPVKPVPAPVKPVLVKPVADLVSAAIRAIVAKAKPAVVLPRAVETMAAVAAPPATSAAAAAEDLSLIRGVDARAVEILNAEGITSFAAIAHWTPADVARFRGLLGPGVPLVRAQWIEQAAMLAAGQTPRHARQRLLRATITLAPRPASTAIARDEGFACALRSLSATPLTGRPQLPAASPAPSEPPVNLAAPIQPSAPAPAPTAAPARAPSPDAPPRHVLTVRVMPPEAVVAVRAAPAPFALPPLILQSRPEIAEAPPAAAATEPLPEPNVADHGLVFDYNSDSLFDIAATTFAEADVQIVPAAAPLLVDDAADDPRPLVYGSGAGSLQSRLRKAGDPDDAFDSRDYAAYRNAVEEAAVEIVHRGGGPRAQPGMDPGTPPAPEDTGPKSVRRFLKALTGQDR